MRMKNSFLCVAVLAMLVIVSGPLWAGSTISLNFSENSANQPFTGNQNIGPLKTNSTYWNTTDTLDSGTLAAGTKSGLINSLGVNTGVSVTWTSSNTWYNSYDGTGNDEAKMAVGYLDDYETSTGVGVAVTFTNIPYARYRVYGLTSSDQNNDVGDYTYQSRNFLVNDAWVYAGGAATTAKAFGCMSDNNNANGQPWTLLVPGSTTAGNYWTIETRGSTLTIKGQPRNGADRCSLTAVIIEIDEQVLAHGPDPSNGATAVPINKVLSWYTAVDPNNTSQVNPNVTKHFVYMSSPSDPNVTLVATIPAGTPPAATAQYDPPGDMERDTTYYWRVDEGINDYLPGDANNLIGETWSFTTVPSTPILDVEPADELIEAGQTAVFTVDATNPFTLDKTDMTYEWYQVGQTDVLSTTTTLEITNAQVADEGKYYCKVILTSNGALVNTRQASLVIRRLIGYWPFDGDLTDTIGGNNGTGTPVFAPGIIGSQAVSFVSGGSPVTVPTIAHTNLAWTLSWWDKSDAGSTGGDWETMIGCGDDPDGWGIFELDRLETFRYVFGFNIGGDYSYTPNDDDYPRGIWHHHALAFEPATSSAAWYIDGQEFSVFSGVGFTAFAAELYIGNVKGLSQPFIGLIDDLRLYNYPLSASEAAELYVAGKPGEKICLESIPYDLNEDCKVDTEDLALFVAAWLQCQLYPTCVN